MKIAFAMINCNRRDGSARAVNEVAERLAGRGHEVTLVARKVEEIDFGLVRWKKVPGPGWPEVADFVSYRWGSDAIFRDGGFDIVHSIGCNTQRADLVTIQNIQPGKRRFLEEAAKWEKISPARRLTRWLYLEATTRAERRLYERKPAPWFLPVSRGVLSELQRFYAIGDAPVRIIPNAADIELFRPMVPEEKRAWRRREGWPEEETLAIFSGGEWKRKGLDWAIRALGESKHRDWSLVVAGQDAAAPDFQALARSCGVEARVRFIGFRRDIPQCLAAADFLLFPSHYEAFSLATIEAAACGLPVLAPPINGTEELIKPGQTGVWLEHEAGQIARVVDGLLERPGCLREMGQAGRALVEKEFTWDRVTDLTESVYEEFVQGRRS